MNAVRMEESAFLIAEDYMKQVIRLWAGYLVLQQGDLRSGEEGDSDCRAVYDNGGCGDESGEDGGGCGRLRVKFK